MKSINEQVKYWIGHCMRAAARELDQQALEVFGLASELRVMASTCPKEPPSPEARG